MRKTGQLILVVCLMMGGCKDRDRKDTPVSSSFIFGEFHVNAEEGMDSVNCRVQFRNGGSDGPIMDSAIKVNLDGNLLAVRAAGLSGAWYEINHAVQGFEGEHRFTVTMLSVTHEVPFTFSIFSVRQVIPDPKGWKIVLKPGSNDETRYRINLIDTAFFSNDVGITATAVNDTLTIPPRALRELASGPVVVEITRDQMARNEAANWFGYLNFSYRIRQQVSWTRAGEPGTGIKN